MLIRAAVPGDIPQLISLAEDSETAAHWSPREYDALFAPEAPKRVALVALETAETVAAFVIARCGREEWEIENVVVDAKLRRRGVGYLLVRELLHLAREHGAADVFLEVRESNMAARVLYRKLGFQEEGRRARYYQNPEEDALVLRLQL